MSFKKFSNNATTSSANKLADKTDDQSGTVKRSEAPKPEPSKAQSEAATPQKP